MEREILYAAPGSDRMLGQGPWELLGRFGIWASGEVVFSLIALCRRLISSERVRKSLETRYFREFAATKTVGKATGELPRAGWNCP
jgi:hypothetical protein